MDLNQGEAVSLKQQQVKYFGATNMGTAYGLRTDQNGCLDTLSKHIEQQLKKREFCVVFEDQLDLCWPKKKLTPAERESQIQTFAKSCGWSAFIHDLDDGRVRAVFRP
jgi:hypothetical protein